MAGRVDLETLLWEAREIMRDLSKVSRAQSAEIERLGGCAWEAARELQERADSAVITVEVALKQVQVADNVIYDYDFEAASDVSSSYAQRHATIAHWAAQTLAFRAEFSGEDAFPLGNDQDGERSVQLYEEDTEVEDEYTGDEVGDTSFASASSSFWKADSFAWADESFRESGEGADDEEEAGNLSGSILNVPELCDDSGRFDSASDSGESFASADMLAHSGVDTDAAETVCSERVHEDFVLPQPPANEAVSHRIIRGRTVSFNVKMTDELDEEDAEEDAKPSTSTSGYPSHLLYNKSVPRLRRLAHQGSLPNINRLFALQE